MRSRQLKYLGLQENEDGLVKLSVSLPDGGQKEIEINKDFKTGSSDLTEEEYQRFTLRTFDFNTPQTLIFDVTGGLGDFIIVLETILTLQREIASQKAANFEFIAVMPDGKLQRFRRLLAALAIFDRIVSKEKPSDWNPKYQTQSMKASPEGARPAYLCMGSFWQFLWANWGIPGRCENPEALITRGSVQTLLTKEYPKIVRQLNLPESGQFVLFCPDAYSMKDNKSWPVEYWLDLTKQAAAHDDLNIIVNSTDTTFDKHFQSLPNVTRFDRMLDVVGLASIVHSAKCVVSVDSGPAHLAGTLKTPCICLWGPTTPLIHGHRNNHNLRVSSCPPCYAGQRSRLCIENVCMKEITSDSVFTLLKRTLDGIYYPQ